MLNKILKKFNGLSSLTKNWMPKYIEYSSLPIDSKLVLVEGGQGSNINGSMFSMLKEIQTNPRWKDYTVVFTVTDATLKKAKQRMKFYGFKRVILSVRNSDDYCKYLATAKYLMTDNSFPPYFVKRNEQVFLNTWHGTPLKTLGKANKSSLNSIANVQKNYLMSDYALFPNEFTRQVFFNDYDLRYTFSGKSLIANYPRNSVFYDKEFALEMKQTLGFEGKKVFAYMPTWRDANTPFEKKQQLKITYDILKEFDDKLSDDTILLVNLHFLLAADIKCDDFKHVQYFSSKYDTYEILNACDGLITDYSSVFFDFAVTGKKIVLFAYDKQDYLRNRGVYMPFESLPFPIVEDVDSCVKQLYTDYNIPQDFIDEYCSNGSKNSCENLFEMMVTGESAHYNLEQNNPQDKDVCLIFAGKLPAHRFSGIKAFIDANPEHKYVISYRKNLEPDKKMLIDQLGSDISVLGQMNMYQFTLKEALALAVTWFFGITKSSKLTERFYARSAKHLFYGLKCSTVVDFSSTNRIMAGVLSHLPGKKYFAKLADFYCPSSKEQKTIAYTQKIEHLHGFSQVDCTKQENENYLANCNSISHISWGNNSKFVNLLPLYFNFNGKMRMISLFKFKATNKVALKDTFISINDKQYKPKFAAFTKRVSNSHFGVYSLSIGFDDIKLMPATNPVTINFKDPLGLYAKCHITYAPILLNQFLGLRGPMFNDRETETTAIFRQSLKNKLNIYVRSSNVTDRLCQRAKQLVAFAVSLLWHSKKAKELVLLFEKNSCKYEESASVLFENLIDQGYNNAYFLIDKNYDHFDQIPKQYLKNIVYKYSFKHYLYFFKCKKFIGTEAIVHSFDLKTFNLLPLRKIADKNNSYVFLQHGVMYMVSLDSESRGMFKRKELKGKYRVVVSSKAEADHFVNLGRHLPEDLYITGLPKFDRNQLSADADKITIMPTWRPWEINAARVDFCETPYFKMIMRLYDSVPDDLKQNVVILPHPLIVNELKKLPSTITDKIVVNAKYDDILKQTAVLITDYSSIAYDAFYRGCRVIFYWEEKDYCMQQYGPTTKLLLNDDNVYGDFFYNTDGLKQAISNNYYGTQSELYKQCYSEIVTYHDGKNTQRLIDCLKQDGII